MKVKRILKRIACFFLVFCLLTFCVFSSSYSTYKVKAEGLAVGASLIIAALVSYMAASGVNIASSSNADGSEVVSMWETICKDYESAGKTLESWYGSASQAVNVVIGEENAQKNIIISSVFCEWLDDLKDWLIDKYHLVNTTSTVIMDSYYVDTSKGKLLVYDSFSSVDGSGAKPESIVPTSIGSDTSIKFNNAYYLRYSFYENTTSHNLAYRSFYICPPNYNLWIEGATGSNTRVGSASVFLYKGTNSENKPSINVGFSYESPYSTGRFYVRQNTSFSVPISTVEGSEISVSGELADGYQDYQDALDQAQSDAGLKGGVAVDVGSWPYEGTYTKEGVAEAYLDRIAATGTAEGTLTGGYTDKKEAEEELEGEYAPSAGWYDNSFVVVDGLEDFFPFCIPFDLYEIIKLLNVPAEAPHFQWKMNFANRFSDYDIDIDLSDYNTIAAIFRIMVIIGFLVFLTLKTRDLIRG